MNVWVYKSTCMASNIYLSLSAWLVIDCSLQKLIQKSRLQQLICMSAHSAMTIIRCRISCRSSSIHLKLSCVRKMCKLPKIECLIMWCCGKLTTFSIVTLNSYIILTRNREISRMICDLLFKQLVGEYLRCTH